MLSKYKGYSATISLDEDLGLMHGELVGISDVVTFQGKTPKELVKAFHESVDDYVAFCEQRQEKPDRPYSGRFVLRVAPELHQQASLAAKRAGMSMNEWIARILEYTLDREMAGGEVRRPM
ncbi:MAG: type II toxin-antitoxin system HicB family antitoxin [Candidatus Nealsonbacteria bacterium]|nr:type II toxin-antitoxin system HicB family antitoxin [Candidatus Nealsonbacteria bacterium]